MRRLRHYIVAFRRLTDCIIERADILVGVEESQCDEGIINQKAFHSTYAIRKDAERHNSKRE